MGQRAITDFDEPTTTTTRSRTSSRAAAAVFYQVEKDLAHAREERRWCR